MTFNDLESHKKCYLYIISIHRKYYQNILHNEWAKDKIQKNPFCMRCRKS